jgi:hypothetical protein
VCRYISTCRVRGLDRQALLRDVRDLRRGGRRAGRLCHRTLTVLQNYYSKSLKNQDAVLAMATSSSQGGTRCVLKTPYLMQQQSLQQAC